MAWDEARPGASQLSRAQRRAIGGIGNKGSALEELVERVNQSYAAQGRAFVFKVPERWRCLGKIEGGFRCTPAAGVVDFIGVAGGKPVAFDCKEVANSLRFPLSRLPEHQFKFLESWHGQGGIAFLLIAFWRAGKICIVPFDTISAAYKEWLQGKGRASISPSGLPTINGADWLGSSVAGPISPV